MDSIISKIIKDVLNYNISDLTVEYQMDGLTNQNYIIAKENEKYILRIGGENSNLLGINRHAEFAVMKAVEGIGVGAEIVYFSADTGNMITKFIEGRKWSNEDVSMPENISRIAETLKKVHKLPPVPFEFSPYRDIEERIQYARENKLELPLYIDKLLYKLNSIKLERENNKEVYLGLCHNDPFPNNFLDDGSVRLIDWEYGGMGDIFFDLSCAAMFYTQAQKEEFLKHYFGKCDLDILKSLEQMTFVVSFWNSMWAVLQTKQSDSKHNYKAMAEYMFSSMKEAL